MDPWCEEMKKREGFVERGAKVAFVKCDKMKTLTFESLLPQIPRTRRHSTPCRATQESTRSHQQAEGQGKCGQELLCHSQGNELERPGKGI